MLLGVDDEDGADDDGFTLAAELRGARRELQGVLASSVVRLARQQADKAAARGAGFAKLLGELRERECNGGPGGAAAWELALAASALRRARADEARKSKMALMSI